MRLLDRLYRLIFRRRKRKVDTRPRYINGRLSVMGGCRVEG